MKQKMARFCKHLSEEIHAENKSIKPIRSSNNLHTSIINTAGQSSFVAEKCKQTISAVLALSMNKIKT